MIFTYHFCVEMVDTTDRRLVITETYMLIYSVVKVLRLYGIPKHSSQVEHILRDISICKYLGSKDMGDSDNCPTNSKNLNIEIIT